MLSPRSRAKGARWGVRSYIILTHKREFLALIIEDETVPKHCEGRAYGIEKVQHMTQEEGREDFERRRTKSCQFDVTWLEL
jgi:hypothetical protein